jgi:hypothetical protein
MVGVSQVQNSVLQILNFLEKELEFSTIIDRLNIF